MLAFGFLALLGQISSTLSVKASMGIGPLICLETCSMALPCVIIPGFGKDFLHIAGINGVFGNSTLMIRIPRVFQTDYITANDVIFP
jgi:hypothetical protein